MPTLPKKINLGAINYHVEVVPRLTDGYDKKRLMGEIKHSLSRIQIDSEAEIQAMATTLMHEIVHYFLMEYGQVSAINPDRVEEVVTAMATGMTLLIRKNPDLIKFLQELDDVC